MVAKLKIKNFSHVSYFMVSSLLRANNSFKHCIETQNSSRWMIISSGDVLPAEARRINPCTPKGKPHYAACSPWRGARRT
jgi:hypothetical protein